MEFQVRSGTSPRGSPAPRVDERSLRIVVIGEFSGRGSTGPSTRRGDLAGRRLLPVDVDSFEKALAICAPRLHLTLDEPAGPALDLAFGGIDDFHPDALYRRLDSFRLLEAMPEEAVEPAASGESDAATFERLLGSRPAAAPKDTAGRDGPDLARFLGDLVAPHVTPHPTARQELHRRAVARAVADRMRSILHHPAFQALEASWRSLHRLVTRLETGPTLRIALLDASRLEIQADIEAAGGDARRSTLQRILAQDAPGSAGGADATVIVGDYQFGAGASDLSLLTGLGALGEHNGATFLAGADPSLIGCATLAATPDPADWTAREPESARRWQEFRARPCAQWVGLAFPRLLLRRPYGRKSDPIERFEFEEMDAPDHATYLWGNPAFGCAEILGRSFTERESGMEPDDDLELDDLPAHLEEVDGERRMRACTEAFLGESAATAILDQGIMPILSRRDRHAARLARFQSVALPPSPLRGVWGGGPRPAHGR